MNVATHVASSLTRDRHPKIAYLEEMALHITVGTGACPYNRTCAQQYVGKSQSCMVVSGRLYPHAPVHRNESAHGNCMGISVVHGMNDDGGG